MNDHIRNPNPMFDAARRSETVLQAAQRDLSDVAESFRHPESDAVLAKKVGLTGVGGLLLFDGMARFFTGLAGGPKDPAKNDPDQPRGPHWTKVFVASGEVLSGMLFTYTGLVRGKIQHPEYRAAKPDMPFPHPFHMPPTLDVARSMEEVNQLWSGQDKKVLFGRGASVALGAVVLNSARKDLHKNAEGERSWVSAIAKGITGAGMIAGGVALHRRG